MNNTAVVYADSVPLSITIPGYWSHNAGLSIYLFEIESCMFVQYNTFHKCVRRILFIYIYIYILRFIPAFHGFMSFNFIYISTFKIYPEIPVMCCTSIYLSCLRIRKPRMFCCFMM